MNPSHKIISDILMIAPEGYILTLTPAEEFRTMSKSSEILTRGKND